MGGVFEAAGRAFGESNDVRWRLHAPTHLPAIHADPVRLRHVLMNLLNNAARCTERGQIVLGAVCLETQVHLWIQDTGCGMTAETLARVRQHRLSGWAHPPHSLDNQDGLGLTIAQHLVELHNLSLIHI